MASVELEGFDDFRKALLALPAELRAEAAPIVKTTAEGMADDLRSEYPHGDTDNLVNGVRLDVDSPLSMRVRSTAKHVHLFEYGTVRRATKDTGANRGVMPAQPVFIPTAIRWRDWMMTRIEADILRKPRPALGEGSLG